MARIKEIIGFDDRGKYGNVHVLLDDGTEAVIYIGGACEVYFDPKFNKIKAFIKRRK